MKKFLIRISVFFIPFPVYICLIVLIDPYNYFNVSNIITNDTRISTSSVLNPQLWKLIEFQHVNAERIILGDSRSGKINIDNIRRISGKEVYNFSYPGGTLIDIIGTFWHVAERQDLKEVYIGINFNLYNDFERNNDVETALKTLENFFTYSFNKQVFVSMIHNIRYEFFNKDIAIGVPKMDLDEFWNFQINVMSKRFYQRYKHPDEYFHELEKISRYCKDHKIQLVFFMPPTHVELQNKIADYHLKEEYNIFINEIASLGPCFNFDRTSDYTTDRKNFIDPFHTINDSLVVNTIWNNKLSLPVPQSLVLSAK